MSRKSNIPIGSSFDTWKVLEKSLFKNASKNQIVKLECTICGTIRTTWLSNLRQNMVKCKECNSKARTIGKAFLTNNIIAAVYPDRIEYLSADSIMPTDATLYKMVSEDLAFLIPPDAPKVKPDPDFGYEASLAVPWDYIDFYCDEVDLDTEASIKAMDLYNSLVEQPRNLQSKHFKGSRSSWVEDGIKMGYIYWKDSKTWPRKPPETLEAPTGALSAESASNVDPAPLVDL